MTREQIEQHRALVETLKAMLPLTDKQAQELASVLADTARTEAEAVACEARQEADGYYR